MRGLRDKQKCQALLNALIVNKVDICMLQETYFTDDNEQWINKMYDTNFTCISSYGSNHSRGVSVLIKKNNAIKIVNKRCDNEGRIILINLTILDELFTVVNVYAPNKEKDRSQLFNKLEKWLLNYGESKENCIVCGDFNITPDPSLDRKNNDRSIDKSNEIFNKMCKNTRLCDVWRVKNPYKTEFTCRAQSRIDLILGTETMKNMTNSVEIKHSYVYSDHQLLFTKLNIVEHARGPGYWKLNCSILNDDMYVTGIKNMLHKLKGEKQNVSNQQFWEVCKVKIKEFTILYCKKKNCQEKMR